MLSVLDSISTVALGVLALAAGWTECVAAMPRVAWLRRIPIVGDGLSRVRVRGWLLGMAIIGFTLILWYANDLEKKKLASQITTLRETTGQIGATTKIVSSTLKSSVDRLDDVSLQIEQNAAAVVAHVQRDLELRIELAEIDRREKVATQYFTSAQRLIAQRSAGNIEISDDQVAEAASIDAIIVMGWFDFLSNIKKLQGELKSDYESGDGETVQLFPLGDPLAALKTSAMQLKSATRRIDYLSEWIRIQTTMNTLQAGFENNGVLLRQAALRILQRIMDSEKKSGQSKG
jgi:hypothetical protein